MSYTESMFPLFKRKEKLFTVCDIGGARVKLVAFRASRNTREATLVDYHEREFPGERGSDETYLGKALSVLTEFIESLAGEEAEYPKTILVSLPHGMTVSRRVEFRTIRPNPAALLTERELAEIWRASADKILKEPEDLSLNQGWTLLTHDLGEIKLDGYPLRGDEHWRGKEVVFSLVLTFWRESLLEVFTAKASHLRSTVICVPRLLLIRDYLIFGYGKDVTGILCDMSSEDCVLSLFQSGELCDFALFPFGGADMTRAIAKNLRVSFMDAETLKRQWAEGRLQTGSVKKIEKAVLPLFEFWKREWALFLEHAAGHCVIRPRFFLSGGGAMAPLFGISLADAEWYGAFATREPGEITRVSESQVPRALLPRWPVHSMNDAVIFALISRMIQKHL